MSLSFRHQPHYFEDRLVVTYVRADEREFELANGWSSALSFKMSSSEISPI